MHSFAHEARFACARKVKNPLLQSFINEARHTFIRRIASRLAKPFKDQPLATEGTIVCWMLQRRERRRSVVRRGLSPPNSSMNLIKECASMNRGICLAVRTHEGKAATGKANGRGAAREIMEPARVREGMDEDDGFTDRPSPNSRRSFSANRGRRSL